ncbi:MAG TPA: hypothetical protein VN256_03540 [Pyrinomonadaceae bacterium]|nr:hypothetical protein [Pyrinomonadaceae bacterium]
MAAEQLILVDAHDRELCVGEKLQAHLEGALVEHEYDHVFVGVHESGPAPDPAEVSEWRDFFDGRCWSPEFRFAVNSSGRNRKDERGDDAG